MCCVEVRASEYARAVVALGDSITDGTMSTPSTNSRWPNFLAARLLNHLSHRDVAVLDQGIGGHAVLHEFLGPNALARFDRDVIAQTAVRYIILLERINELVYSTQIQKALAPVTLYWPTSSLSSEHMRRRLKYSAEH